ncbi:inositol monophosphatase family protein [Streptomyces sp. NPDC085946]|uniref:inositol monophosphatase family protein n=1 Tax=Streptomyces sp. NPDC085946 TaxID=3365744 RepID=UPI0037D445AA
MPHRNLLAALAAAAREAGAALTAVPRPAPADTPGQLAEELIALEEPAAEVLRHRLAEIRPGVPWVEGLDDDVVPVSRGGEVWIVDVVDGAVQYVQGLPQFCVSLTLVRDGEPVAAVLHAPLLGGTYLAARGHGATLDGRPVTPSGKTDPAAALVATGHPPFAARQPGAAEAAGRSLTAVLPHVGAVRSLGPASWQIADTAAGRLDAFWQFGRDGTGLLPGALIAREAGALVTDARGRHWTAGSDSVLVAAPGLHGRMLELLAGIGLDGATRRG